MVSNKATASIIRTVNRVIHTLRNSKAIPMADNSNREIIAISLRTAIRGPTRTALILIIKQAADMMAAVTTRKASKVVMVSDANCNSGAFSNHVW